MPTENSRCDSRCRIRHVFWLFCEKGSNYLLRKFVQTYYYYFFFKRVIFVMRNCSIWSMKEKETSSPTRGGCDSFIRDLAVRMTTPSSSLMLAIFARIFSRATRCEMLLPLVWMRLSRHEQDYKYIWARTYTGCRSNSFSLFFPLALSLYPPLVLVFPRRMQSAKAIKQE